MRIFLFTCCIALTAGACTSTVSSDRKPNGTGSMAANPNGMGSGATGASLGGSGSVNTGAGGAGQGVTGAGGSGSGVAGNPDTPAVFTCPATVADKPPVRRLWRLTPAQFMNTQAAVLSSTRRAGTSPLPAVPAGESPLLPVDSNARYTTLSDNVTVAAPEFSKLLIFAQTHADQLVLGAKAGCWANSSSGPGLDACLTTLIQDKGTILFRRPLAADEIAYYADIVKNDQTANGAMVGPDGALSLAFQAMILAPHSLFQPEIGADVTPGVSRLTPYEVASSLSYALTASPPDAELWDAAANGQLTMRDQIKAQVTRLTAGPVASGTRGFVTEYFELRRLLGVPKTADIGSTGCQYQRSQVVRQAEALVNDVVTNNSATGFFATLFTTPTQFYSCSTEGVLGLTGGPMADQAPAKGMAPAGQRAGFLTSPALMGALASRDATMAIRRGKFINTEVLCRGVPDVDLAAIPMLDSTGLTQRERFAAHIGAGADSCAGCHSILDDAGLAFENYDTLGAYRTMDQVTPEMAKPIDAHGTLSGVGDADGPFQNAIELTTRFSTSATVEQCVMRNGFRYFMGRQEFGYDSCALTNAQKAYKESGGSYVEFIATLLTSESFMNRSY